MVPEAVTIAYSLAAWFAVLFLFLRWRGKHEQQKMRLMREARAQFERRHPVDDRERAIKKCEGLFVNGNWTYGMYVSHVEWLMDGKPYKWEDGEPIPCSREERIAYLKKKAKAAHPRTPKPGDVIVYNGGVKRVVSHVEMPLQPGEWVTNPWALAEVSARRAGWRTQTWCPCGCFHQRRECAYDLNERR